MDYDFAVVGGGSAGYAAARTATDLGLKTVVIEGGREMAGLCILRGCMPSKALIESANRLRVMREAAEFGLHAGDTGYDGAAIIARKRRLIGEFADYRREQLTSGKFDLLRGLATFVDANTLSIAQAEGRAPDARAETKHTLTARSILIASGSVIRQPSIPGIEDCLTSDDLLDLAEIPDSIVVLGAGPVALEMAHYLDGLGKRVTVIQRGKQLLKGIDADLADVVEKAFRRRGMEIFTETKLLRIERDGASRRVLFEHQGKEITREAVAVLNALGREPALAGLALDKAGVKTAHGAVEANAHQQTSVPHIFAAGDCCGPYEVVHLAIEQAELAARNAACLLRGGAAPESMDYRLKLYAVFTEPQVASVGLTEEEARKEGRKILTATYPFNDHGKSLIMNELDGFVKLIVDAGTREILGGSLVGPHAADLIHEIVVAMRFRATAGQLASTPHYHPTLSEIWTYPASELAETPHEVSCPGEVRQD